MRNREKRREMSTRKLSSTCFTDEQYFNEANSAGAVLQLQQKLNMYLLFFEDKYDKYFIK